MVKYGVIRSILLSYRLVKYNHSSYRFMSNVDHYKVLGVPRTASMKDIRQAYIELSKKYHPDSNRNTNASSEDFQKIQQSYDVLRNIHKRLDYDRDLRSQFTQQDFDAFYQHVREKEKERMKNNQFYRSSYHQEKTYHKKEEFNQFRVQPRSIDHIRDVFIFFMYYAVAIYFINIVMSAWASIQQKRYSKMYHKEASRIQKKDMSNWTNEEREFIGHYNKRYNVESVKQTID